MLTTITTADTESVYHVIGSMVGPCDVSVRVWAISFGGGHDGEPTHIGFRVRVSPGLTWNYHTANFSSSLQGANLKVPWDTKAEDHWSLSGMIALYEHPLESDLIEAFRDADPIWALFTALCKDIPYLTLSEQAKEVSSVLSLQILSAVAPSPPELKFPRVIVTFLVPNKNKEGTNTPKVGSSLTCGQVLTFFSGQILAAGIAIGLLYAITMAFSW